MLIAIIAGLAFLALTYWAFAYVLLYHLTRFGVGTLPKRIAAIFLLGSFILISVLMIALANINLPSILATLT
ncbi:hypothetical protein KW785_03330 [Candidatus Parcubacteria bacterium]|nr:hypothetical protein [Candidatus Parcubacteria bacterium]